MRMFQPRHVKKVPEIPQEGSVKSAKSPECTPFGTFGTEVLAHSAKKILETRDTILEQNREGHQEPIAKSAKTIDRLPWQLERLLSAAENERLPSGTATLEGGLVPDLNRYTLAWGCAYLRGSVSDALPRLWVVWEFWQQKRMVQA
jgi:hypothetical protein